MTQPTSTFILVPGTWHGGWSWQPVARRLRANGHVAVPVTLPGLADGDSCVGLHLPRDPAAAARALLDIVDAEQPPLRVLFGALFGVPTPEIVRETYNRRLNEWTAWEDLAIRAYGR